jgi:hypothetical protein
VSPGLDEVTGTPTSGDDTIHIGTAVFFRNDVFFDHRHGIIGVAPRT